MPDQKDQTKDRPFPTLPTLHLLLTSATKAGNERRPPLKIP